MDNTRTAPPRPEAALNYTIEVSKREKALLLRLRQLSREQCRMVVIELPDFTWRKVGQAEGSKE